MWDAIKTNVLLPSGTRVGTFVAGALVSYGVASDHATIIGTALPVAMLVGIDLMLAWFRKRAIQKKSAS